MEINKAELASAAAAHGAATQELRGAEILVKALQAEGVKYIWGYPGGAVLHIYDAFYKQDTIQHVLVRHEQAAVHAADGYARATGDVGVSLVTSGPGLTNAVTGIATAYMDSIPMVIIAGQVPTAAIGLDAFQECDTVGITRPIVKHNFLVKDVRDLAMVMKKAFHIARTGRPGPVVVDIPKDVSFNKTAFAGYPESVEMRSYNPVRKGHGGQIRKALQLLLTAKRPYIYTGGGVLLGNAVQELRTLVDLLGYPVTNTLMGLGAYPASDRKFLGMLGMHGTVEANNAMQNCDVLLAVGARFDDRVIGNPKHFAQNERKIIHIDIDPSSISKRVKVDVPIVGDVKDVLTELINMVRETSTRADEKALAGWWEAIEGWRSTDCLKYDRGNKDVIKPQYVVETLWNMTKDADAYITSDVGQHQMWAAQYYKFNEPRRWINSGGLGTMGVGIPYAMGIKLAKPESEVFCVTGEGSVQMCIQELSTCLQYNTPIKIVALNNRYLGMVRQWQELDYEGRYSHSYMDALPNFVKLAEAYGHVGMLIERPQDVEGALREARKLKDRTVFMDFRTDPTENVFPMVRAGKGITEMTLGAEDL
ncbi:MAG TPA: acetolactate synthase 3 large subunit [Hydrogenophaga sp.]|jgi:acetolactate synthase-1/2/3 large subunit|uniref:acetolactate synthase 3 catalytic subunit n=1 Tax=Hydrogenophaga sp. TaxID=1904254 RepID=UPI0008D05EF1|nr:acetolactate synthase 3 catalytic subunit [Hydrogenophaga sp.]OGA75986.1 MAG: acetolactate synthase, large subunit, biosynthetic type [Burkholderiales bacterium GWE1_65_30]OGA89863.1 MAG: acetolactate synthase, large subunit, biosynthetic type [Burkholderiales bacterium GWF1_66_17]PKO76251.1 MAG: acetolactate synthase, large subunit, biosynthetic type [Betaproteobacteria bacterium HGW-Betaproteobacteria-15]HAX20965.1 acetolactate synthase 3 large subunit [Hydrogenophaga sp.]